MRPRHGKNRGALAITAIAVVAAVSQWMASPVWGQTCEDRDGDGYAVGQGSCGTPDCNDSDASVSPDGIEVCNGLDDDCNGLPDDAVSCDRTCDNPELLPIVHRVSTVDTKTSRRPSMAWTGDGWVVAWEHFYDGACSELRVRHLAVDGTPVGDPVVLAGEAGSNIQVQNVDIAWSGEEYALTWSQAAAHPDCSSINSQIHVFAQLFDERFDAVAAAQQLDCGEFESSNPARVAWGTSRFGVVWVKGRVLFSSVDRDSTISIACGQSIGEPVLGNSAPSRARLVADGPTFGIVWWDAELNTDFINIFDEVYFRRVDEYDVSPDPSPHRITFDPARSERPSVTSNDGGWGITWADTRDAFNKNEIYATRLAQDGTKIDPPGDVRVTCCNTAEEGDPIRLNRIEWTGEEYGVAYLDENHPTDVTGDVFFQRLDAAMSPIGDPVLVTGDNAKKVSRFDLGWNGESFGVAWDNEVAALPNRQVYFGTVGCNCTDDDNDLFSSCAGGDCNDDDPLINPFAAEACLDGQDNNCDGAADCQDGTACPPGGGSPPGAVSGLLFGADKETLSWSPEPSADVYDLLTGDLGDLQADADYSRSRCLAVRVAGTSHPDPAVPAAGEGLYYLVRGKADPCLLGTWGSVLRDDAQLTCP